MGRDFPLIADEALVPLDAAEYPRCQVCARPGSVYPTFGSVLGAKSKKRDKVFAACAACFQAGKLEQIRPTLPIVQAVQEYLRGQYPKKSASWLAKRQKELLDALDRMPCRLPPLQQEMDWPLCCGELAEYLGCPAARPELTQRTDLRAWNFGVDERSLEEGISFDGCPDEMLADVAVFQCRACAQHYLIFQPS